MKTILFSVSFSLFTICVRSKLEPNTDYFVMTEAHITEYRSKEDANAGYLPFYVECYTPVTKFSCHPAIPKMDSKEGYVTFRKYDDSLSTNVYYACPQSIRSNVLNPDQHYEKALMMQYAKSTRHQTFAMPLYYNIYKYRCESEVFPVLWKILPLQGTKILYGIGFLLNGIENMPLAEVYYDYNRQIPIWTKHTLYGASLAAPTAAFKSIEEIVYQTDLATYTVEDLQTTIESYDQFNNPTGEIRQLFNNIWKDYRMSQLPEEIRIVMGHLVPEYDMIMSNWHKISKFAQTIVPTWEELYLNEWIDVEEMIRDISFQKDLKLTVYSGTEGQLTLNTTKKEYAEKIKFHIGTEKDAIVVPELIWKIVISDESRIKKATVVVFRNLTENLIDSGIFSEITPPCTTICNKILPQRNVGPKSNKLKLIYCCTVQQAKNKIQTLPEDVKDEVYDVLFR